MTTTPNGNGNGNGYTQKEMLVAIMARLDTMQAGLEASRLAHAVHEAKPHHDSAREEMDALKTAVDASTKKLAAYAGGIAVAAFIVQIVLRYLAP